MARVTSDATCRSQRKLALVIGIGNYDHEKKLTNPGNDAKALSLLLQRMGFIVEGPQLDKTKVEIEHTLVDFTNSIQDNDVVLFYFAGHGVQWEDKNFLLPKDFPELKTLDSKKGKADIFRKNAINAQNILNDLSDRKPYVTIFLLDCCRKYVLQDPDINKRGNDGSDSATGGLTPMHKAGSIIAFACAPGTVADDGVKDQNSLFMKHLLKYLPTPKEDIKDILCDVTNGVMKDSEDEQIPFTSIQLRHKKIYVYEQSESKKRSFEYSDKRISMKLVLSAKYAEARCLVHFVYEELQLN